MAPQEMSRLYIWECRFALRLTRVCNTFDGVAKSSVYSRLYVKGKPFGGEYQFYACTHEKSIEHFGVCQEFPCDYFPVYVDSMLC
jgi:hypothetical protein